MADMNENLRPEKGVSNLRTAPRLTVTGGSDFHPPAEAGRALLKVIQAVAERDALVQKEHV